MITGIGGLALAVPAATATAAQPLANTAAAPTWATGGNDLTVDRNQPFETKIGASNAATLHPKWAATVGGDVSATPSVDKKNVYFPDSKGDVYAFNNSNGHLVWRASVSAITGIPGDYARDTPAIAGPNLILGDQGGKFGTPSNPTGAWVFALNSKTGALVWKTQVDPEFSAIVSQSAQVVGTTAYVGVASNEEAYAASAYNQGTFNCCTFRGSMLALDTKTGAIKWQTYTVPTGYSGAGVWGSTPAIDRSRGQVYITTGNNYSAPASAIACMQTASNPKSCMDPADHFDSMLALNLKTGAIVWSMNGLVESDVWNLDCGLGFPPFDTVGPNCPAGAGPDFDFGQAPAMLTVTVNGAQRDVVGAGQKSGDYWLVDRSTGGIVWHTKVGPGGTLGGAEWGSATDGNQIYVANANSGNLLQPGFWAALNPNTGAANWTTSDPAFTPFTYSAVGAVSVANGVVYACTMNATGTMFAMDAQTGAVLWSFNPGGSCNAGPAIANGTVYWGSGYGAFAPLSTPNNTFYAFTTA